METGRGFPGIRKYALALVKTALAEDVGSGDITTDALIPEGRRGSAEIRARQDLVLAGVFVPELVFRTLDSGSVFKSGYRDGDFVRKGGVIATVSGRLAALLTGERVALNFLQRMSGIATLTREFVRRVEPTGAKILDTRKTTPCLRMLERYAVKAGGGYNHRAGLYDAVLIKDNHIEAVGGVAVAIKRVNSVYREGVPVEAEASNLKEVREALIAGADIIMLDNMEPAKIRKALGIIKKRALVEASGGITLANVREVARAGVDFISVGAITHSAPSVDISMEVIHGRKARG